MLTPVPIDNLHQYWEWVRSGLIECRRKGGGHLAPEDVYVILKSGNAHLFLITSGFCVLQRIQDSDGWALFVLALWTEPGMADWSGTLDALDNLARELKCVRIRQQSGRGGGRAVWERRTKFKAVSIIYEREL